MHRWQEQWEGFNQRSAEPRRQAEVQQARIAQLEQSLERLAERQRRLADGWPSWQPIRKMPRFSNWPSSWPPASCSWKNLHAAEAGQAERLEQLRSELQQATQAQQRAQGELQRLNGRIASLEALQQAALNPGKGAAEWLREHQLNNRPRLAEGLRAWKAAGSWRWRRCSVPICRPCCWTISII